MHQIQSIIPFDHTIHRNYEIFALFDDRNNNAINNNNNNNNNNINHAYTSIYYPCEIATDLNNNLHTLSFADIDNGNIMQTTEIGKTVKFNNIDFPVVCVLDDFDIEKYKASVNDNNFNDNNMNNDMNEVKKTFCFCFFVVVCHYF